jgi:hypothetical protein
MCCGQQCNAIKLSEPTRQSSAIRPCVGQYSSLVRGPITGSEYPCSFKRTIETDSSQIAATAPESQPSHLAWSSR